MTDPVNHPAHYTAHPSGIECIQITEHMGFNLGNTIKYVWRADLKGDALEDLRKARWYLDREIARIEPAQPDWTCTDRNGQEWWCDDDGTWWKSGGGGPSDPTVDDSGIGFETLRTLYGPLVEETR